MSIKSANSRFKGHLDFWVNLGGLFDTNPAYDNVRKLQNLKLML